MSTPTREPAERCPEPVEGSTSTEPASGRPLSVADEMFAPVGQGVELCYQTFGDPGDEPLLLVMGLGGPMTWWDSELCEQLARAGFYVCRFDNRDIGRSTLLKDKRVARSLLVRAFLGRPINPPYKMSDLAADALGLMDHLGWQSAHLAGISMGGMITQTMACTAPDRVRSLTSIMSSTGRRTVGWQHPSLLSTLLASRGPTRDDYVNASLKVWRMIGSPDYPVAVEKSRSRAGDTFDRGISRAGVMRQMLAVVTQPDRTPRLRELSVPVSVVHGLADRMVHVSGGRATAAAVRGAELLLIPGMGHDLPPALFDTFVDAIRRTADRAVAHS